MTYGKRSVSTAYRIVSAAIFVVDASDRAFQQSSTHYWLKFTSRISNSSGLRIAATPFGKRQGRRFATLT
jgi:hypothetical protein